MKEEEVILVNNNDLEIGTMGKMKSHIILLDCGVIQLVVIQDQKKKQ